MKKVIFTAALFLLVFASGVFAASDTIILVTDLTSVDAATATAAAAKTGVPVLVLENGLLNNATRGAIDDLAPNTIVLVGGPAVIKPEVEAQLNTTYNVIRLWGMERTGTAVAVANHFWPEGAPCAVLVLDTKNSNMDSARQEKASEFAAHFNCTLVPIPEGTLPAEVLKMLTDLNVDNVWYIGRTAMPGLRNELRQFRYKEIFGDDDEIQRAVENQTNVTKSKLVVIATPDWKAAVGLAAHPWSRTVVRHISNVSQVPALIDFIRSNNITNVTVAGLPDLAQQVADMLTAANITVTKISGNKAGELARDLARRYRMEWEEKRRVHEKEKIHQLAKIKDHLLDALNDTQEYLDSLEAEISSLPASQNVTNLLNAINQSRAKLANFTALIQNASYDEAKNLLAEVKSTIKALRLANKDLLGLDVNSEIRDEEDNLDEAAQKTDDSFSDIWNRLDKIKSGCRNTEILDAMIDKVKSVRNEMRDEQERGNFWQSAKLAIQGRELANLARHMEDSCSKKGSMPENSDNFAKRRGINSGNGKD